MSIYIPDFDPCDATCSLVEMMCVPEEKIDLVCWHFLHDVDAMENVVIWLYCELSLSSFKFDNLVVGICNRG